jgi:hypothetical protein
MGQRAFLRCWLAAFAASAVLTACQSSPASRAQFRAGNPLDRARAIRHGGDAGSAHHMVDMLEDEDPGVRLYAITALTRLFHADLGYRYYASGYERSAAVERWRTALRTGEFQRAHDAAATDEVAPEQATVAPPAAGTTP